MKSHEAPVTESMQQCIDYIKQNEDEIAEYVNSLFLFDIFCDFPIIVETPKTTWKRDDALASITSNYTVKANLPSGDWSGTVSFACTISGN